MKLLNEMTEDWEINDLVAEMDETIAQYQNLISLTKLYEGKVDHFIVEGDEDGDEKKSKKKITTILDTLPDNLIEKITEIQRRMAVIVKARDMVKKLKDSGWDKKKIRWHKKRLYDNNERLRKSMYAARKKMDALEKTVQDTVQDIEPEDGLSYSES